MEFIRSLQSELLKVKGTRITLITVLGGLLLSTIFTSRFITIGKHIDLLASDVAWQSIFSLNTRPFLGFIVPIGAILICTLITQIEYKNNNWKQVHTTPQHLSSIFLAKFTILFALTILLFLILNIGIILHGVLPCLILDGQLPIHPFPLKYFIIGTFKCFILTLPVIAFQYLLSLHFKNFMVAFGVGLTVYVGSMPGVKLGKISYFSPYNFVLKYFDQVITTQHYWMALGYFVVLILASYFLYINKGEKG